MRAWVVGLAMVLLGSPAWADDPRDAPSGMAGGLRMVAEAERGSIEGQVSLRPVRSVERRGVPNQRPYEARITILDTAGHEVGSAESDAEGKFSITLSPGTYVLRPESPGPYPRASEQRVTVRRNTVTRVDIVYDSGMR